MSAFAPIPRAPTSPAPPTTRRSAFVGSIGITSNAAVALARRHTLREETCGHDVLLVVRGMTSIAGIESRNQLNPMEW